VRTWGFPKKLTTIPMSAALPAVSMEAHSFARPIAQAALVGFGTD